MEVLEGKDKNIARHSRRGNFPVHFLPQFPLLPVLPLMFIAILFFSPKLHAQTSQSSAVSPPAHDLGGVWMPFPDKRENGEPVISGIEEKTRPPLTPWGQARFDAAIPFLGPRVQPGKENNPSLRCEPEAVPKSLILPNALTHSAIGDSCA